MQDLIEHLILKKLKKCKKAIDVALEIWRKGHYPYIPHLTHYVDKRIKKWKKRVKIRLEWEDYIVWDMPWLEVCDALFFIGSSEGAEFELKMAQQMGKRIFYN